MKNRSSRKIKKRNILYLVLIFLIFGVFAGIFSILKVRRWDGVHHFNVVLATSPILVFSFDPNLHQATILLVPSNTFLEVPYGYGNYPAGSIYRLGNLDIARGGGNLLGKSMENTFGIVIDAYFAPKSKKLADLSLLDKAQIQKIKNNYFSFHGAILSFAQILAYLSETDTNLSLIDKFNLWNAIRTLRIDNISLLDPSGSMVVSDQKLPDGEVVKIIDKELFDAFIGDKFQDNLVRVENISVEIINASGEDGVAYQFGRTLKNLGANVLVKTTAERNEDYTCSVFTLRKELVQSHIVQRLKQLYQCNISKDLSDKNIADIQVVLGRGFLK
jgi:hypothetical protein